jgi:Fibrobacter succinogenes major domain (Fib_succ_major)
MKKSLWQYLAAATGVCILISTGCNKENLILNSSVNTLGITLITPVSATCSAVITSAGNSGIIEKGVCWSRSESATVNDNKAVVNAFPESQGFTEDICGLTSNTKYFVRAYATGNAGTVYGNELSFTTPVDRSGEKGDVTDIDGNTYQTIGIGSQIWTLENLRTTKFNDSTDILLGKCYRCWNFLTSPGYCWYNNDENNKSIYGALYNWYTVNTMKLCPSGWHVPGADEWTILETFVGESNAASAISALAGGYRGDSADFINLGENGVFWTSTPVSTDQALYRELSTKNPVESRGTYPISWGASVRCVKD